MCRSRVRVLPGRTISLSSRSISEIALCERRECRVVSNDRRRCAAINRHFAAQFTPVFVVASCRAGVHGSDSRAYGVTLTKCNYERRPSNRVWIRVCVCVCGDWGRDDRAFLESSRRRRERERGFYLEFLGRGASVTSRDLAGQSLPRISRCSLAVGALRVQ